MEIKEGDVYHIKNDYFELVNDDKLMKNDVSKQIKNWRYNRCYCSR